MGALEPCRPPDTPVFQDETDARQHLLGLFGAERMKSELVNFSVTPAEEGASGFVTAVAAR